MKEIENYLKYKRNKNTKNKINGKNVNCQQIDCSHILMATWYSFLEHIIVQVQASGGTKCLKSQLAWFCLQDKNGVSDGQTDKICPLKIWSEYCDTDVGPSENLKNLPLLIYNGAPQL